MPTAFCLPDVVFNRRAHDKVIEDLDFEFRCYRVVMHLADQHNSAFVRRVGAASRAVCPELAENEDLGYSLSSAQVDQLITFPGEACAAVAFPPGTPPPTEVDPLTYERFQRTGFVVVIRPASARVPGQLAFGVNVFDVSMVGEDFQRPQQFARKIKQLAWNPALNNSCNEDTFKKRRYDNKALYCSRIWSAVTEEERARHHLPADFFAWEPEAINKFYHYLVYESDWANTFYPPEIMVVANSYTPFRKVAETFGLRAARELILRVLLGHRQTSFLRSTAQTGNNNNTAHWLQPNQASPDSPSRRRRALTSPLFSQAMERLTLCTAQEGGQFALRQGWYSPEEFLTTTQVPIDRNGIQLSETPSVTRAEQSFLTFESPHTLRQRILALANKKRASSTKLGHTALDDQSIAQLSHIFNLSLKRQMSSYNRAALDYIREVSALPLQTLYRCTAVGVMRARLMKEYFEAGLQLLAEQYVDRYIAPLQIGLTKPLGCAERSAGLRRPLLAKQLHQAPQGLADSKSPSHEVAAIKANLQAMHRRYQQTCPKKADKIQEYLTTVEALANAAPPQLQDIANILQQMALDPVLRQNRGLRGYMLNRWYGYHCQGRDNAAVYYASAQGVTAPALVEATLKHCRRPS